jgi:glycosyltransferase 2 family protein
MKASPPARSWWSRWGWVVRWGGTVAGFVYILRIIDLSSLKSAFAHASVVTLLAALAMISFGLSLGAVRWRILMRAYGARTQPSLYQAIRFYFVAVFYNTYLPGGVAGDILRGVVTRKSFGDRGTTEAIAVVLVERALGLLGVVSLVAVGLGLAGPAIHDSGSLWIWSAVGAAGSMGVVLMLPLGRQLARFLPSRLGDIASRLPVVSRPLDFFLAAILSLFTQLTTAVSGWLFLRDFHPATTLGDALFIVPLAAATTFLPITVGGTGAREAVFILLCGQLLGMPSSDALAASLLVWLTSLIAGALGGLWQVMGGGMERPQPAESPVESPVDP